MILLNQANTQEKFRTQWSMTKVKDPTFLKTEYFEFVSFQNKQEKCKLCSYFTRKTFRKSLILQKKLFAMFLNRQFLLLERRGEGGGRLCWYLKFSTLLAPFSSPEKCQIAQVDSKKLWMYRQTVALQGKKCLLQHFFGVRTTLWWKEGKWLLLNNLHDVLC